MLHDCIIIKEQTGVASTRIYMSTGLSSGPINIGWIISERDSCCLLIFRHLNNLCLQHLFPLCFLWIFGFLICKFFFPPLSPLGLLNIICSIFFLWYAFLFLHSSYFFSYTHGLKMWSLCCQGRMILAHLCDEPKGLKTGMCMVFHLSIFPVQIIQWCCILSVLMVLCML